jgi:hypothetical protein
MGRQKKVLRCANDDSVATTGGKLTAPFWSFWGKQNPFQATSRAFLECPRIFASSAYATKKLGIHPTVQSEWSHLSIPFGDWNGLFFRQPLVAHGSFGRTLLLPIVLHRLKFPPGPCAVGELAILGL